MSNLKCTVCQLNKISLILLNNVRNGVLYCIVLLCSYLLNLYLHSKVFPVTKVYWYSVKWWHSLMRLLECTLYSQADIYIRNTWVIIGDEAPLSIAGLHPKSHLFTFKLDLQIGQCGVFIQSRPKHFIQTLYSIKAQIDYVLF